MTKIYNISEIPDTSDTRFLGLAEGDVQGKIQSGFEQIWHTLAHMPAGSAEVKIIYFYRPAAKGRHKQDRLSIFLELSSFDKTVLDSIDSLISQGVLSRFYAFDPVKGKPYDKNKFMSSCYIKRRSHFVEPLYTNEFNSSIPKLYFMISPFGACPDNNYLLLDQNLDKIKESVLITLKVCPADISRHLRAHTEYLAQLYSVNRTWLHDIEDNYIDDGKWHRNDERTHSKLEPLNFRDPLSDDTSRIQRRFHETLMDPHFQFEFKILTTEAAIGRLIASTICNCAFADGKYKISGGDEPKTTVSESFDILIDLEQYATIEELAGIMKLPIGSYNSPLCIRKNNDPKSLEGDNVIVFGHDIQGFKYDDAIVRGAMSDLLCKHLGVFGLPGQGKTTFIISLMIQLWVLGIPFIVIECAKREYRVLKTLKDHNDPRVKKLARDIRIYTPGNDEISPFRFNPLDYPEGVYELAHIESIKSCIESSIPVSCGSVPALLFEGLEDIYEFYRNSKNRPIPVMADLVSQIEHVFATKNYTSDIKTNMQTVIEVRLSSLAKSMIGKVFQCSEGTGVGQLVQVPMILEIDALPKEHKCVLTLFLTNAIREYFSVIHEKRADGLQHVLMVEESHNILGSSAQSVVSEDMTDPQIGVAEYFSNLLVELRSLGCGIVICDQHPSNIHESASKSVASSITFRETHAKDRDERRDSMLLGQTEHQDTARLKPGQAYLFMEGYYGPRKIQTENLHHWLNLKNKPSDKQLKAILEQEGWFKSDREKRIGAELIQLSFAIDEYEYYRKWAKKRFNKITRRFVSALDVKDKTLRQNQLRIIFGEFKRLKADITEKHRRFKKGSWKTYRYLEKEYPHERSDIADFGSGVFRLYKNRSDPFTRSLVERIEKNIKKLSLIYSKGL